MAHDDVGDGFAAHFTPVGEDDVAAHHLQHVEQRRAGGVEPRHW